MPSEAGGSNWTPASLLASTPPQPVGNLAGSPAGEANGEAAEMHDDIVAGRRGTRLASAVPLGGRSPPTVGGGLGAGRCCGRWLALDAVLILANVTGGKPEGSRIPRLATPPAE